MNCKSGDMVVIIGGEHGTGCKCALGKIRKVTTSFTSTLGFFSWYFDQKIPCTNGGNSIGAAADKVLKPLPPESDVNSLDVHKELETI